MSSTHLGQKTLMQTEIVCKFGMERREPRCVGPPQHGVTVVLGEHFDPGAHPFDDGGADEHTFEGRAEAVDLERRLEGFPLTAVAVAAHADVEDVEGLL